MDFSLFQFDRDLTFAAFFMNSDKTIYGRFGTRTENSKHQNVLCAIEENPYSFLDSDVTLVAFEKTVTAALDIHREYSVGNETLKTSLAAKRGPRLTWNSSNTLPALQTWRKRADKP